MDQLFQGGVDGLCAGGTRPFVADYTVSIQDIEFKN
jgi:hypothetical protein